MTLGKEDGAGDNDSHLSYKKDFRTAMPQFLAVSVKNLLLLGYGMTLGFPTILMPAVSTHTDGEVLYLEKSQISWINAINTSTLAVVGSFEPFVSFALPIHATIIRYFRYNVDFDYILRKSSSINLIVVPIGCALSGLVTSPLGRRRAMQIVNIPFFVAWLMFYYSTSISHLYGALFLTGLAGGLLEAPVLTYVAEITQPHLRGLLSATSSMSIILGVFTQFLIGLFLYWRAVALVNIVFTILAVVALCFVPESPHWLVSKERHDEARKSLQWLRGWTTPEAVDTELKEIQAMFKIEKVKPEDTMVTFAENISLYFQMSFLVPFFLVCLSFFVGHFSGMTTLQTYAVSIFQMLEAPIDKYYATLILGIMQILGSGLCVLLVHFTGKRPLTLFSTAGAAVCCLLVAAYDLYIQNYSISDTEQKKQFSYVISEVTAENNTTESGLLAAGGMHTVLNNPYTWMPTTLLMLLALITHTGIRLLPWILIGEIFSAKTRSGGAGLASAVGYIFGFLTNKMYISMVDSMSLWGTYGLYGIISAVGCVIFYFILPETEGKKLNEIENHYAGITKLTNNVYRSKRRPNSKIFYPDISKMEELYRTNMSYEEDDKSKVSS